MVHPSRRLNDDVHQRTRLGILVVLAEAGRVEFTYLRDTLGLTAGNLSRNLTRLQEAGLVQASKDAQARRPRTWLAITPAGRHELEAEVTALRELLGAVGDARPATGLRPATGTT